MITCSFEHGRPADPPGLRHVVVDALVLRDDKILMVKRAARMTAAGKWAVIGGYVDYGERVTASVIREVLEETGWEIEPNPTLMRIDDSPQVADDADRCNVSFVFICEATKKTGVPDDESEAQEWYPLEALPPVEQIAFNHAETIDMYKRYRREGFALPVLG